MIFRLFFAPPTTTFIIYETLKSFLPRYILLVWFVYLVAAHGIGPYLVISPPHFDKEFERFSMSPHHESPLPMKSLCLNFPTHSFLSGWLIDAVTHVTSIALDKIWNWHNFVFFYLFSLATQASNGMKRSHISTYMIKMEIERKNQNKIESWSG